MFLTPQTAQKTNLDHTSVFLSDQTNEDHVRSSKATKQILGWNRFHWYTAVSNPLKLNNLYIFELGLICCLQDVENHHDATELWKLCGFIQFLSGYYFSVCFGGISSYQLLARITIASLCNHTWLFLLNQLVKLLTPWQWIPNYNYCFSLI